MLTTILCREAAGSPDASGLRDYLRLAAALDNSADVLGAARLAFVQSLDVIDVLTARRAQMAEERPVSRAGAAFMIALWLALAAVAIVMIPDLLA